MSHWQDLPVQAATRSGLTWLAKVQNQDGSWGTRKQHGRTGMALLCFSDYNQGILPTFEVYKETIGKGIQWLIKEAMKRDIMGSKRGYEHGISTLALAELYRTHPSPELKKALGKAIQIITDGQQKEGGFDYAYRKGERYDMCVSSWNFHALSAAYLSGSDNVNLPEAIRKAKDFIKAKSHGGGSGTTFDYSFGKHSAGSNMTGIGVSSLQKLGEQRSIEIRGGILTILSNRQEYFAEVKERPGDWNRLAKQRLYGWFFDTQAMFNYGSEHWKPWRQLSMEIILKHQQKEGFWESDKGHGQGSDLDGRILTTTWALYQLIYPYRQHQLLIPQKY